MKQRHVQLLGRSIDLNRLISQRVNAALLIVSAQPTDDELNKRLLKLSQQRILADGSSEPNNTMWMVPIEIATKSSPDKFTHWFVLDGPQAEMVIDNIQPGEWFKVFFLYSLKIIV